MRLLSQMCSQLLLNNSRQHKTHLHSNLQMPARLQSKTLSVEISMMMMITKRQKKMARNLWPLTEPSQVRKQRKWILPSKPRPLSQPMPPRKAPPH